MSNPNISFHKVNTLPSTGKKGDLYFVKDEKKIYIRTDSSWEDYNGVPVNNLTTTTTGKVLDAAQGNVLKKALDTGLAKKADIGDIDTGWVQVKNYNPSNIDLVKMGIGTNTSGANRLAFLPADQIVIEKTTDGGVTWEDYGASDNTKKNLFLGKDVVDKISIPLKDGVRSADCAVRITITAMKFNVPNDTPETEKVNYWTSEYVKSHDRYFGGNGVLDIWVNDHGGTIKVLVETRRGNRTTWDNKGTITNIKGQTGRSMFSMGYILGGSISQITNIWCWRFTFSGDTGFDISPTRPQIIHSIRYYSGNVWYEANNLMADNHLYTWNTLQDAIFPASVYATQFIEGDTVLSNKYANRTYNAKSYEAVVIYTDNTDAHKKANVAAIKAYTDNLKSLGVSIDSGYIIPIRTENGQFGILSGYSTTPRLYGYVNKDNSYYQVTITIDGTVAVNQLQSTASSALTTTSKSIIGAINELKTEAGLRDDDISAVQSQALAAQEVASTAQNEATDAKNKVTALEGKIPTIDSELSDTSTNPVQNKILKTCLDNIADNVDEVSTSVTTLSNKETTIAGQKVKVGGTITKDNLLKGLQICTQALHLIKSDNAGNLTKIMQFCSANNIDVEGDYFTVPVFEYNGTSDIEPDFGIFQNIPSMHWLKGTLTSADTTDPSECMSVAISTTTGEIEFGNAFANAVNLEYAEVEMTYPNVSVGFSTATILPDYLFDKFRRLGMKKYVKFTSNTIPSAAASGNKVELILTQESTTQLTFQHVYYYYDGGSFQPDFLEFTLNLSTKVLTAMYPKGMV